MSLVKKDVFKLLNFGNSGGISSEEINIFNSIFNDLEEGYRTGRMKHFITEKDKKKAEFCLSNIPFIRKKFDECGRNFEIKMVRILGKIFIYTNNFKTLKLLLKISFKVLHMKFIKENQLKKSIVLVEYLCYKCLKIGAIDEYEYILETNYTPQNYEFSKAAAVSNYIIKQDINEFDDREIEIINKKFNNFKNPPHIINGFLIQEDKIDRDELKMIFNLFIIKPLFEKKK